MEPIRNEPEFRALVDEIKADMAGQLDELRRKEASGELNLLPSSFNN